MFLRWVSRLIVVSSMLAWQVGATAQNPRPQSKDTNETATAGTETTLSAKGAAVTSEYKVGEGDVLHINVWKEPDLSKSVTVRPDGNISMPLINEVKVSGMTTAEISRLLGGKLKAFLVDPQVNVEVAEIHSRRVFITGEIARPGSYQLSGPTTVLQFIAQAGGFTPFAKRKKIVILRKQNGQEFRLSFNYPEVASGHKPEQDVTLIPGDTVVVP